MAQMQLFKQEAGDAEQLIIAATTVVQEQPIIAIATVAQEQPTIAVSQEQQQILQLSDVTDAAQSYKYIRRLVLIALSSVCCRACGCVRRCVLSRCYTHVG
jgi:hypothetical protein